MTKKPIRSLDDEIDHILAYMGRTNVDTKEYADAVQNLKVLYEAKSKKTYIVSPDAVLAAITNLLGITLILNHEKVNVVTSRAFGLIFRPK